MKIIITEEQIRRFNKQGLNKGPLGKAVEKIILNYLGPKKIVDLAVFHNGSESNSQYVALVLHNGASDYKLDTKLMSLIYKLLDHTVMVMINDVDFDGKNYYNPNEINESVDKSNLKVLSKFVLSLPRPNIDKIDVDYDTGETNGDDFFWPLIDILDYKSDNSYKRVKEIILDLYRFTGALSYEDIMLFIKILEFKLRALEKHHGDKIRGVSDDSWGDLKADIVSRGKDFYDKAISDFDLVQKMSNDIDYTESFYYGIPYISDLT
jgi:hypothetical protein